MPVTQRDILFKLHQNVLKLTQSPPTTFTGSTGTVKQDTVYQPNSVPLPLPPGPKYNG